VEPDEGGAKLAAVAAWSRDGPVTIVKTTAVVSGNAESVHGCKGMKEAAMSWPERSTGGGTFDAPSQGNTGLRRTASFDDAHATARRVAAACPARVTDGK
jgi:hypothetical protein